MRGPKGSVAKAYGAMRGAKKQMVAGERYAFEKHAKAWGRAHSGPGIRFICESAAA